MGINVFFLTCKYGKAFISQFPGLRAQTKVVLNRLSTDLLCFY